MPNNLPPPILPQPSPGASLGVSPPPPPGVAAVDNQMMQPHSPQHQLAQHQPMPGFRMPDHHTPPAGIRQQTHSSHMMMGRPEPHHHMVSMFYNYNWCKSNLFDRRWRCNASSLLS